MKKWAMICLAGFLLLVLSACNSTAEPTSDSEDAVEGKEESNVSELTLEEVYEKAMERQSELKSSSADIKMDQKMTFGNGTEGMEMSTASDMKMDMIVEPLETYMDGTIQTADPVSGEDTTIDMEMYMTQEGIFMHEPDTKQWLKLPSEQFDAIVGQTANQVDVSDQLKQLQTFIDDFKFEQTDSEYILTLNAASEEFSDFILEQMQLSEMLGMTEEDKQLFENISFDTVNYVISIDKETFDIHKMDTVVDMTLEIEGEAITVNTDAKIAFNNFNGVEDITVPQEVIDQAVEIQY
ncbi:DUF6612 family protein [Ureibacillus aquaedulcis]|uniref:Lipoprotein n=1 Tax=Ureibacillus aquaedulcis TaxID=3058421 RepID=A0ABT8GVI6_9BACL|nr:DUF6612 family protein [Ureibacillus sp. BA0131]MDN4495209.1 hypothetical protein [Ureibacillus sp. BA0131]